ncbi:hypothetical protein F4678DRAFT_22823 [Xylaria arbuscula]|nr:hypothetical protein F4678DRAFT_22823 [Xylaria arbuscula]
MIATIQSVHHDREPEQPKRLLASVRQAAKKPTWTNPGRTQGAGDPHGGKSLAEDRVYVSGSGKREAELAHGLRSVMRGLWCSCSVGSRALLPETLLTNPQIVQHYGPTVALPTAPVHVSIDHILYRSAAQMCQQLQICIQECHHLLCCTCFALHRVQSAGLVTPNEQKKNRACLQRRWLVAIREQKPASAQIVKSTAPS